jgi:glycosyltransferase involved in cell wall biosynthesis
VQDKNPDYLIRGFINANLEGKKLVLCGGVDGNNKYEAYLNGLTNSKDVIFTGPIFGADKDAAYRNCYAFCIPSTLEGLPMSLLEAMSYGKIAIASDIPACHEALGESGIYVPYEDDTSISNALRELAFSEEKFEWQKEANRERAKTLFSWENTTRKYLDFLETI